MNIVANKITNKGILFFFISIMNLPKNFFLDGRIGMGQAQSQSTGGDNCNECIPKTGNLQNNQGNVQQPVIAKVRQNEAEKPIYISPSGELYRAQTHSQIEPSEITKQGFFQPMTGLTQLPNNAIQQPQNKVPSLLPAPYHGISVPGNNFPQHGQNGKQFQPTDIAHLGISSQETQPVQGSSGFIYPINLATTNFKPGDQTSTPLIYPSGSTYPVIPIYSNNQPTQPNQASSFFPASSISTSFIPQSTGQQIQPSIEYTGNSLPTNKFTLYSNTPDFLQSVAVPVSKLYTNFKPTETQNQPLSRSNINPSTGVPLLYSQSQPITYQLQSPSWQQFRNSLLNSEKSVTEPQFGKPLTQNNIPQVQGYILVPYNVQPPFINKHSNANGRGSTFNHAPWNEKYGVPVENSIPVQLRYVSQEIQPVSNYGLYPPPAEPRHVEYNPAHNNFTAIPYTGSSAAPTGIPIYSNTNIPGSISNINSIPGYYSVPFGGFSIFPSFTGNIPQIISNDSKLVFNPMQTNQTNTLLSNYLTDSSNILQTHSPVLPIFTGAKNVQENIVTDLQNSNPSNNTNGNRGIDVSQGMQIIPIDTESGESESLSSIHVNDNNTNAEASAQGNMHSGVSQAQVSGTYTGSFSAQAQTSDNGKSVMTQIFGNKTGALSVSHGTAGRSQSQSQIQYNYGSGASIAETQGKGINYGTNVQIQTGIKGGLADAQASGSGSSNSQAQIGFVPYDENQKKQQSVFEGGGTASSQSGKVSGQSQIQFQGSFKIGPSFTGAAQSSSGMHVQNSTKLVFNSNNLSLLRNHETKDTPHSDTVLQKSGVIKITEPLINSADLDNQQPTNEHNQSRFHETNKKSKDVNSEKYNDEESTKISKSFMGTGISDKQKTFQSQNTDIRSKEHDAIIYRDSIDNVKENTVFNSGDIVPKTNNYRIPSGFRGRVTSTAGDETIAVAAPGGRAQTQTVILKPGSGKVTEHHTKKDDLQDDTSTPEKKKYDSYITITNSETGELNSDRRKYGHTYYSRSSTCGYFTYTCSLIEDTNGRTKVCKPGPPTLSDGTPC